MPRVKWSGPAVSDLSNIREWLIAETSPKFALDMLSRIRATADRLSAFPARGSRISTDTHKISVPGTPYRILYQVGCNGVEVLRVRHGRENWRPGRSKAL